MRIGNININDKEFKDYCNSLIGTRFRHMGNNPQVGLDCVNYVINCYEHFNLIPHLELDNYSFSWWYTSDINPIFEGIKYNLPTLKEIKDPLDFRLGDILCFSQGLAQEAHVGIYIEDGWFNHSVFRVGLQKNKLIDEWATIFTKKYRIRED